MSSEEIINDERLLLPIHENYRVDQSRFKDRYKFKFQHLIIDLTKTETVRAAQIRESPSYEVEIEIGDMEYFL
jgi:hypothetical protein